MPAAGRAGNTATPLDQTRHFVMRHYGTGTRPSIVNFGTSMGGIIKLSLSDGEIKGLVLLLTSAGKRSRWSQGRQLVVRT